MIQFCSISEASSKQHSSATDAGPRRYLKKNNEMSVPYHVKEGHDLPNYDEAEPAVATQG